MSAMASQITSLAIVYSTVYSGTDQRKHQISASLAFVRGIHRWPVDSPHQGPVTRKMVPFDYVIMCSYTLARTASHAHAHIQTYAHTIVKNRRVYAYKYDDIYIYIYWTIRLIGENNIYLLQCGITGMDQLTCITAMYIIVAVNALGLHRRHSISNHYDDKSENQICFTTYMRVSLVCFIRSWWIGKIYLLIILTG